MMASSNVDRINLVEDIVEAMNLVVTVVTASEGKPAEAVLRVDRGSLQVASDRLTGHLLSLQKEEGGQLPPLPLRRLRVKLQALTNALSELLAEGATVHEQRAAWDRVFELLAPTMRTATLASRAALTAERRRFKGR